MHLCDDLNVIELVDRSGRKTPAEGASDLIRLTVLYNRLMPLLRYEIDDRLRLAQEPCRCGSRFRRVAEIEGRAQEALLYGGVPVQAQLFHRVLGCDRRITQYQVRQTLRGAEIDVIAPAGMQDDMGHRLKTEVVAALTQQGLPQLEITIRGVSEIPRLPSGKQPRCVPLH
jgi:phenylacetate-coenzyme A ligase PaaK-like adenylate-forming protein